MLKEKTLISAKQAEKLIYDMARYSNNSYSMKNGADHQIKGWFSANKQPWRDLVSRCRNPQEAIPFVENLIGPDFTVLCDGGGSVSTTVLHYGHEGAKLIGAGQISLADYQSKYIRALEARRSAIKKGSYLELLDCITHSIASIESYINMRASLWNRLHNRIEFDVGGMTSLDIKLNDWLYAMTGYSLKKFCAMWDHFNEYRNLNNKAFKHNKTGSYAVSFEEMAKLINRFKSGIAGVHFQLHRLFDEAIPSQIVRGKYLPEVFV